MKDKICLITGATSGIGKATAIALSEMGYSLILTGRNNKRGEILVNKIRKKFQNQTAEFIRADISSRSDVIQLTEKIMSEYNHLDVLINNAGARYNKYQKSGDGIELTFATNHLGHFLLTLQLIDLLKASSSARIINVASSAHFGYSNDFNQAADPLHYNRKEAYGKSKLANLMFTYELARRLQDKRISVNAVDPGGVITNLGRNNGFIPWSKHILYYLLKQKLITPGQGAETIVYLASSPETSGVSGKYFYRKNKIQSSRESYDKKSATKLWNLSLGLCNIMDFNSE